MDFGFYYRPAVNRILFHYLPGAEFPDACCYDTYVSESRIASYIGVAKGEIPPQVVFGTHRSWPDTCESSWTETRPSRLHAHLLRHAGLRRLAPVQRHARHAELGREHVRGADAVAVRARGGLGARQLGRQPPADGRRADPPRPASRPATATGASRLPTSQRAATRYYGVDGIGSDSGGNPSNNDRTLIDHGWPGCPGARPALPDPPPSAYTNGVVTPHAAFLALRYRPGSGARRPARGSSATSTSTRGSGFLDSVNVDTGVVVVLVPVARPGHDHGRARQRARP